MHNTATTRMFVRQALGLPASNRVLLEIDETGHAFRDTWCDRHPDQPAAVHAAYWRNNGTEDEADWKEVLAAYSWDVAADALKTVLDDPAIDHHNGITVIVNAWYLLYHFPAVAA